MRNCLCCECPIGGQKPLIDQTAFDQTRAFLNKCFVLVTQVLDDEGIVNSDFIVLLRRNYEPKYCSDTNERVERICHPKIIYRWTMEKGFNTKFFSFSLRANIIGHHLHTCSYAQTGRLRGGSGGGAGVLRVRGRQLDKSLISNGLTRLWVCYGTLCLHTKHSRVCHVGCRQKS